MAASLRDIGILAHIDAGKTSLTERILYISGRIRAAGDIDEGTTATDYLEVERERGITVKAAAAHLDWRPRRGGSAPGSEEPASGEAVRINLIDTPGHVDFSSEVGRSLRALDGAVILLCAVAGVQSRTEALYRACARRSVSRLVFINKLDRRGASFDRAFADLKRLLDPGAVAVQLPWGEGESFRGIVDLVEMRAYSGSEPAAFPPELEVEAREARMALIEALAESDEELFADFVAGRDPGPERLRRVLRAATIAGKATPVLCGSAFSDQAASLLLDAIADYLPAPAEASRPAAFPAADAAKGAGPSALAPVVLGPEDPFSALVFKTSRDPHFGRLAWLRVRSGSVSAGDRVFDSGSGKTVRVLRIFGIQADKLEEAESAADGDIVALAFPGQNGQPSRGAEAGAVASGSTLSDPRHPVRYEAPVSSVPVVSLALEPRWAADADKLRAGAASLAEEDPSLVLREDPQTGRLELSGMGELHLEIAVERLRGDFGAHLRSGEPRVEYRERLLSRAEGSEDFDRDLGGERARAQVALSLGPSKEGGFTFSAAENLRLSPALLDAARRGAEAALSLGPSAGYPLEGASVLLERLALPGASLSSPGKLGERAAEIASSLAASVALRAAGTTVVEPVMRLEIAVPEAFLGPVAAAIATRGGRVESIDGAPDGSRMVSGAAPLGRLFGFAGELRSCTEGRAEYSARFMRYEAAESMPAT